MAPVIGVEAIRALNDGTFTLKTMDELNEMPFGCHSRKILNEVSTTPMVEPWKVKQIARKAGLSEKQASLSLECMVNRRDQVFTKFKDPDLITYQMQLQRLQTPLKSGWLQEALDDLTIAIDELGVSTLAIRLDRVFGSYNKLPWNYIPLIKFKQQPIYAQMQLQIMRLL
ncbi:MAG: hypothetical protein NTY03_17045 [Candidatus Bathyarchaeota archaeon]|jgi:hypothetical protein|nr:hypothetical protein [Candidatus Bathyarchaeota archaeon]